MLEEILENPTVKAFCFITGLLVGGAAAMMKGSLAENVKLKETCYGDYHEITGYSKRDYTHLLATSLAFELPTIIGLAILGNAPIELSAFGLGYYLPQLIGLRKKSWGECYFE